MKTFKPISVILALTCIFYMSCQKNSTLYSNDTLDNRGIQNELSPNSSAIKSEEELLSITTVTFCSPQIVPLCAGQHIDMGTVTVKTGSDDNIYVTYQTKGNWFLKELHLYAGNDEGVPQIPSTNNGNPIPGQFPYAITFSPPYVIQQYTFVIPNMPSSVTIAAHASVLKIAIGNTNIIDQQTAWGDGCSGTPINGSTSGNWGTKFTYTKGSCAPADICSKPVHYFFDSTLNGLDIPWIDINGLGISNGDVTVGGYDYTEAEGRDIYNSNGYGTSDARNCFVQVAALKLSSTNFALDVQLLAAVTTCETWLLARGKLTPTTLYAYNSTVRDAANYIAFWISRHTCGDRR